MVFEQSSWSSWLLRDVVDNDGDDVSTTVAVCADVDSLRSSFVAELVDVKQHRSW